MENKRFTQEEANVLTRAGFARYVQKLRGLGFTHERAYEAAEGMHQQVDESGERKYSDFSNYTRLQRPSKQRKTDATLRT